MGKLMADKLSLSVKSLLALSGAALVALLVFLNFYAIAGQPFAVYSEQDGTLTFYDRLIRPKDDAYFDGKTATYVFWNLDSDTPDYEETGNGSYSDYVEKNWLNGDFKEGVLSVSFADEVHFTSCENLFYKFSNCTRFDLTNLDTEGCLSFASMFAWCESVKEIDLSGLNFSSGADFHHMFFECSSLESINMEGADLSSGESFQQMFNECPSLISLTLDNLDFNSGTNFDFMFDDCRSLDFDCSNWDVSNAAMAKYFANGATGVVEPKWPLNCDTTPYTQLTDTYRPEESLRKVVEERYTSDSLRHDKKYIKYAYYNAEGDLVGTKTEWFDGKESEYIFDNYKDEYSYLP